MPLQIAGRSCQHINQTPRPRRVATIVGNQDSRQMTWYSLCTVTSYLELTAGGSIGLQTLFLVTTRSLLNISSAFQSPGSIAPVHMKREVSWGWLLQTEIKAACWSPSAHLVGTKLHQTSRSSSRRIAFLLPAIHEKTNSLAGSTRIPSAALPVTYTPPRSNPDREPMSDIVSACHRQSNSHQEDAGLALL